MKRLLLLLAVMPLGLRAGTSVGLLPEDKVPVTVTETERNPFGKNMPKAVAAAVENEESRIRSIVEHLPVGGVVEGRTGRKVVLGSHFLEEGRLLAPVIAHQTEKLRVVALTPEKAEIAFLESDGTPGLRRIVIVLNMAPNVQYRVARPTSRTGGDGAAEFDGALKKDEVGATR